MSNTDNINHHSHYTQGDLEVIDAIEGLGLGYHAGNIVKYVARYKFKNGVEDLKKARWYLDRLIQDEDTAEQGVVYGVSTTVVRTVRNEEQETE